MMQTYAQLFHVLYAFFVRDVRIHKRSFVDDCINYGILWPITFGFSFAVLRKNILFTSPDVDPYFGSMVLVGSIVVPLMVIASKITFDLMFDLASRKYVLYQMSFLPARWLLLQRLMGATLYTFVIGSLFFPAALLFLQNHFIIQNAAFFTLSGMLLLSAFVMCTIQQLCALIVTIETMEIFWVRCNGLLMTMGGAFIPTASLVHTPFIGILFFLNPVLHMTEGIRGILYPGSTVIPVYFCVLYLLAISSLCVLGSWYLFKKKVDHL
jgi:ABC-type polysaccharide/polyol phosphate export permease